MGDPRFEVGAPYNVGTCKAGGVCSKSALLCIQVLASSRCGTDRISSSLPVQPARLAARTTARSSLTVMLRILTAAMEAMRRPTTVTVLSMGIKL